MLLPEADDEPVLVEVDETVLLAVAPPLPPALAAPAPESSLVVAEAQDVGAAEHRHRRDERKKAG